MGSRNWLRAATAARQRRLLKNLQKLREWRRSKLGSDGRMSGGSASSSSSSSSTSGSGVITESGINLVSAKQAASSAAREVI
jgi:hypothetical protein